MSPWLDATDTRRERERERGGEYRESIERVLTARSGRIICKNGILSVVDVDERASRRVRARDPARNT